MRITSAFALASAMAAASAAAQTAEPFAWDADTWPPQTARIQIWRGDTVPLAPRWGASETNDWTFTSYWSTNGAAWWSKSLLSSPAPTLAGDPFRWTPAMDCGARRYRLFILAQNAGGGSYRANADIQMMDSPGTDPSILPAPGAYPALANELIGMLLPHLPTYDAWSAESAARASADAAGRDYTDSVAASIRTQIVGSAASSYSALRLASADSNWWVTVESGTAALWRAVAPWVELTPAYSGQWPATGGTNAFPFSSGVWSAFTATYNHEGLFSAGDLVVFYGGYSTAFDDRYWVASPSGAETRAMTCAVPSSGVCTYHREPLLRPCGRYATAEELAAAVSNALARAGDPASATNALAWSTNAFALASNAWLRAGAALGAAQAADARITAATNTLVQTFYSSSNAWLTADFSNNTLSATVVFTNGTTKTVTTGGSGGSSVDPAATNALWVALNAYVAALSSSVAGKADQAWGKYAPDGSHNPDPDYMTWLNAPATVFASGCSWSTYGAYAVLVSAGTVAFSSGTNGMWRLGPDSTNYLGYATGGSVVVGAAPSSLRVYQGGTSNGYAEITYGHASGDFPQLWFTPSLGVDFAPLGPESAVWVDNLDGTATVTAPATAERGFWRATTSAEFAYQFVTTMPANLAGGVLAGTNSLPVVYDSVIEISYGGATYRVPAERR